MSSSAPSRSTSSRVPAGWRGAAAASIAAGRGAMRTPCNAPRLALPKKAADHAAKARGEVALSTLTMA